MIPPTLGLDINTKHTHLQTLARQDKERQGEETLPVMAGAEHWEAADGTPRGLGSASVVVLILAVLGKVDGRTSLLHSPIEV